MQALKREGAARFALPTAWLNTKPNQFVLYCIKCKITLLALALESIYSTRVCHFYGSGRIGRSALRVDARARLGRKRGSKVESYLFTHLSSSCPRTLYASGWLPSQRLQPRALPPAPVVQYAMDEPPQGIRCTKGQTHFCMLQCPNNKSQTSLRSEHRDRRQKEMHPPLRISPSLSALSTLPINHQS